MDAGFLKSLPKRYIRVKFGLNKAKIKADGLDAEALSAFGLIRVTIGGMFAEMTATAAMA